MAARSTGVPMVTGSKPWEAKDLFPVPRASPSPPSFGWVPNARNPYSRGMRTLHHLPKSTAALQIVLADQRLWKHLQKKQQAEVGDHGPIGAKLVGTQNSK